MLCSSLACETVCFLQDSQRALEQHTECTSPQISVSEKRTCIEYGVVHRREYHGDAEVGSPNLNCFDHVGHTQNHRASANKNLICPRETTGSMQSRSASFLRNKDISGCALDDSLFLTGQDCDWYLEEDKYFPSNLFFGPFTTDLEVRFKSWDPDNSSSANASPENDKIDCLSPDACSGPGSTTIAELSLPSAPTYGVELDKVLRDFRGPTYTTDCRSRRQVPCHEQTRPLNLTLRPCYIPLLPGYTSTVIAAPEPNMSEPIRKKPPTTKAIGIEDLKQQFVMERPRAEKNLKLKRTTFSNLCRHYGISKWPYRLIRDAKLRMVANKKLLVSSLFKQERISKLRREQSLLQKVIDIIYEDPTVSRNSNTLAVLMTMVGRETYGETSVIYEDETAFPDGSR